MSENRLSILILIAGTLLLLLLPAGTAFGTTSTFFSAIFFLHLVTLLAALGLALFELTGLFRRTTLVGRFAFAIGTLALMLSLLESTLPVTFRDSLIHHLAVPQWWVETGHIEAFTWHEWSFYPMLINLGFTGLIANGLGGLAGSYNWVLALLFCATVASGTARISTQPLAGALAFLIATTLPIIHRLSPLPTADMGLALFSAITFFSLLRCFVYTDASKETREQLLLISGVALGLALGCKYNALPFALFSLLLALMVLARKGSLSALRSLLLVGVAALLLYSPWLIRNYSLTQNPIYPLYSNIFKPSIERPAGLPNLKPLEQRKLIYQESPLEIALLPFRIFIEGEDDKPAAFDGALSPLLLIGFLALLAIRNDKTIGYAVALSLLVIVLSIFLNPMRVRYLAPIYAPLIYLSARMLVLLLTRQRIMRGVTFAAIGAHLILFGSYAGQKATQEKLFDVISGTISRPEYLRQRVAEYPMIEFINQHIAPESTIYLLFTGNRFALYRPRTFSGGHYSASVLVDWIRKSERTGKPLSQFFHEHPIDFLLADSQRSQSFALEQLNERERQIWTDFVAANLKFVREDRGFSLWQVVK